MLNRYICKHACIHRRTFDIFKIMNNKDKSTHLQMASDNMNAEISSEYI